MALFLGIDTSNYTTSAALYDSSTDAMISEKQLLPVKEGSRGIRQSDAVFHHTVALPRILGRFDCLTGLSAVSVSDRPCDREGSYFPCFLTGVACAEAIAKTNGIPLYINSHQHGHIAAALYSADRRDLLKDEFLAFHVSGGTTESVLCRPDGEKIFSAELIASSLDLNAGQVIDRVGVSMGLPFPAGRYVEEFALKSEKKFSPRPFMRGGSPSLSGLENKCADMLKNGDSKEDTALFCLTFIRSALEKMLVSAFSAYGEKPVVFSGGVMSDSILRDYFTEKYGAVFALPQYSTDNAAGTALLGYMKYDSDRNKADGNSAQHLR